MHERVDGGEGCSGRTEVNWFAQVTQGKVKCMTAPYTERGQGKIYRQELQYVFSCTEPPTHACHAENREKQTEHCDGDEHRGSLKQQHMPPP